MAKKAKVLKKGKPKTSASFQEKTKVEKVLEEVWPLERDFFERPDRYRYVRKLARPKTCVFCSAEKKRLSFDSLVLAKTQHAMVILNKYPYNSGHLLVLPRKHIGEIWELGEEELMEITKWTQSSMRILHEVYQCKGLNMGMNHGAVAGAGIPDHIHWHIVPRWLGDTNFFPLIAQTRALPETLKQTYERLRPAFKEELKKWESK
ncbi:MAG: HIT family hydrolase [Bdellovibrionaceae bacterium]|nr:HIT family hydrolase [Pseudobdellovibrionaceae bacterium]